MSTDPDDERAAIEAQVYDWLAERFGENVACALIPDPDYTDDTPADTLREGRKRFIRWRDAKVKHRTVDYLRS